MGKDDDGKDQTFEEYVKKQVISQMKQKFLEKNHQMANTL